MDGLREGDKHNLRMSSVGMLSFQWTEVINVCVDSKPAVILVGVVLGVRLESVLDLRRYPNNRKGR